jgi:hypothetical protein
MTQGAFQEPGERLVDRYWTVRPSGIELHADFRVALRIPSPGVIRPSASKGPDLCERLDNFAHRSTTCAVGEHKLMGLETLCEETLA